MKRPEGRCISLYKPYKHTPLSPSAPQLLPLVFQFFFCHLSKIISLPLFFLLVTNSTCTTSPFLSQLSLACSPLLFSTCASFSPQLLSNKQCPWIPMWTPLLELLFSKTLLIWLRTSWGPWPSLSAAVYGIRYAWNTFDLTEGFSHVFPTVTTVCGFKQILWVCVCVSPCVYAVLYVCIARRCMTDLKYSHL